MVQTSPALEPMEGGTAPPVPEKEEEPAPAQEEAVTTEEIAQPPVAPKVEEVAPQPPVTTEAPPAAQESATPKPSPVVASAPSPAPQAGTGLTAPAKVDRASSGQVHEPSPALWKQSEP
jgi:hypothetical protein